MYIDYPTKNSIPLNLDSLFYVAGVSSTLEKIGIAFDVDTKIGSINQAFVNQNLLKEIDYVFDFSNIKAFSGTFAQCVSLEKITIKPNTIFVSIDFQHSKSISDVSIQSIIDGLATVETAQTLKLHKDVKAKLTETQIATITSKNWTLA